MLTAAVRDLHLSNPGRFITGVRTSCGPLWQHNPRISALEEDDPAVRQIECLYPLINQSNQRPYHFIHGFSQFIGGELGVPVHPGLFRGDIHLAPEEKRWMSQVQEITRRPIPFWIIVAGGKYDCTIKWWEHRRFQEVVDHFQGRILFVQAGQSHHEHPPLRGVLDLRGKTGIRQFVRLMHHAQGVLCPVTFAMHLAAAVEARPDQGRHRPCVVVAGGREPTHWEAYPHHQFLHTIGALSCCATGGCWKARTVRRNDGEAYDESLCRNLVGELPRCMDMISSEDVARRISLYFEGGMTRYLTKEEAVCAAEAIARSGPSGAENDK